MFVPRFEAPADLRTDITEKTSTRVGLVPHTLRGYLGHFATLLIKGEAFDRCVGCSELIVKEYQKRGFEFLMDTFNTPLYLEELTGLTTMKQEDVNLDIEWDDNDENE